MSKIILFPFVIIISIYATIVFIVPTFKENASLKEEIKNQEARKAKSNEDLSILKKFINDSDNHKIEQGFLNNFVPKDVEEDKLINTISRYAIESGVTIMSLNFESDNTRKIKRNNKSDLKNVEKVESSMIVTGTYENLYKFIERMFIINRLYAFTSGNIETMSEKLKKENAPSDQLTLTLSFKYFNTSPLIGNINDVKMLGDVDYAKITKIKNKVSKVADIEAQVQSRQNPFAP